MAENLITALILRRTGVAWTSVQEKKGRLEIADQCTAALEIPPSAATLADAEATALIRARCGGVKGRLTVALPTDLALLRVLQLPTTDAAELRSMVELQVDKFAPFALEHMVVGLEVLEQKEGGSRVLVGAAAIEQVEQLGQACFKAGLSPTEVDVEVLGWWRLLQDAQVLARSGRELVLILDDTASDLILTQDGVPLLFRSLGSHRPADAHEAAADIAEELRFTLAALETEWGAFPAGPLQLWHAAGFGSDFLAALGAAIGRPLQTHALDSLPALSEGLARRAAARTADTLDLAPPDWKTASATRRTRQRVMIAVGALVGVWLLAAAVFLILLQIRTSGLNKVKAESRRLSGPAGEVRQLQAQLQALERYSDRTFSGIECLREVSALLPAGVELTSLNYKKYTSVTLRGEAATSDPIYDFFQKLEASELFKEVKPEGVTDEVRGGKQKSQFRVTLVLPEEEA
jgi:Tfp pilus assembly protein PilN